MPVDFTNKKKEKSNYDYLKEALVGNTEGLEFLEGFKSDYEKVVENLTDEISKKDEEIDEKDTTITEMGREAEYFEEVDTRLGANDNIRFDAPNLAAKNMMEELQNAIHRGISLVKIENILRAL